eukprot:CAMPEP_0198235612 /NCGR_PEP_ID=MMETSP1446-20131203/1497_1 /TAXON_ID=1461542 ORGANISM="Unidentified sp, Strain CCMP2111" /NCGR_SAMPLE_ID=MMETSP1446 /ASSEMBLY_ACC=CAM_ASM_001112 /LENGTH=128 /DNA_ID=CAMNT_0043916883 /DNA_START=334 /DNA_END=720 /DNA_ORIENTATION=+
MPQDVRGRLPTSRPGLFSTNTDDNTASSSYGGYDEERENDRTIDNMAERASALKRITIDIQDEAQQQQRLLDGIDSAMDKSKLAVGNVSQYMGRVFKNGNTRKFFFMIVGVVILLLILYKVATGGHSQ